MRSFLEYVAEDIISKYGTDLSQTAVVFPNKRASLFLNEHLAHIAGKPLWSPSYITISDLFRKYSPLLVGDNIKLVCDLHKSFVECTGIDETLDHFYGWGILLLSDFDDIDKNMADPSKVFANLTNYHELDDVSYLSGEQVETIKRFFSNFSEDTNSELKKRFISLWSHFHDIYTSFNKRLESQGLAYEGAVYRRVATDTSIEFRFKRYIFVGFNMLQEVERHLFKRLLKSGQAKFYWDFDKYYMSHGRSGTSEAGHYISSYIAEFPNELDSNSDEIYNNFGSDKNITYIATSTDNIQARYVSEWLKDNNRTPDGKKSAVVMCNESLLKAVVHSFPEELSKVNVTTGYPLAETPWSSLLTVLLNLQTHGYSASRDSFRLQYVNAVLGHPYISYISQRHNELFESLNVYSKVYYPDRKQLSIDKGTSLLFCDVDSDFAGRSFTGRLVSWLLSVVKFIAGCSSEVGDQLFKESMFQTYTLLNRIMALIESDDLVIDIVTLQRLLRQILSTTTIPFHGEPAVGLQIMGILETRNLDFDHLLILSCNEGNMPKGINDTSFIPYSIRKAFGLTTIDNKIAIYSYYFYRLLQRTNDVTIMYNDSVTNGSTGEMSRFMLQIMIESGHRVNKVSLLAGQTPSISRPSPIAKSEKTMQMLLSRFDKTQGNPDVSSLLPQLTPSAINKYMRCQLQFYYNYVCKIKETHDDDDIDNRIFGNIFHYASQAIYESLTEKDRTITASRIEAVLKDKSFIERIVDTAFKKELFKMTEPFDGKKPDYNGLQLINREVIITYLCRLLEIDLRQTPFTIIGLEHDVVVDYDINVGEMAFTTTIGGRVDRIDKVCRNGDWQVRIVDYKTGGRKPTALPDLDSVFDPSRIKDHSDYYLQAILYSMIFSGEKTFANVPVVPALLFIQHAGGDDYDPALCFGRQPITNVEDYRHDFEQHLRQIITEIFNKEKPFEPTADTKICQMCPYIQICGL